MTPKHTPGHWIAVPMLNNIGAGTEVCTGDGTRRLIASPAFCPEHRANARLIAAAPEMLEALQEIDRGDLFSNCRIILERAGHPGLAKGLAKFETEARAIIAKATEGGE